MIGKFEEQCLLALIRSGTASTPAQVYEVMTERVVGVPKFGAMFTTLNRMVEKKWVKVISTPDRPEDKPRKRYTITGLGQKELSDSLISTDRLMEGLNLPGLVGV